MIFYYRKRHLVGVGRHIPGGSVVKNPPANAGDVRDSDSIPGLGRSPGEGNGYPLQYSCLENPVDQGAWQATAHGLSKDLDTTLMKTKPPLPLTRLSPGSSPAIPTLLSF